MGIPPVYALPVPWVGIPPCICPPCTTLVGIPVLYTSRTHRPWHAQYRGECDINSYSRVVKEGRVLEARRGLFLPQNKPLFLAETEPKEPRNPLQRVPVYKRDKNPPTPPGSVSNPPQGKPPPFHTFLLFLTVPAPGPCFSTF